MLNKNKNTRGRLLIWIMLMLFFVGVSFTASRFIKNVYAEFYYVIGYRTDRANPMNVVNITEGGGSESLSFRLSGQPVADVTVTPNITGGWNAQDVTWSPQTLTFTPSNWSTEQVVNVSAVDDVLIEGQEQTTMGELTSSTDPNWNNAYSSGMVIYIYDNDPVTISGVNITQTDSGTAVAEGGATDTYSVVLATSPSSSVTININSGTQATATPSSLTFTSANWSTPQIVTIAAVNDSNIEGAHSTTVTHTAVSSSASYNGIGISNVTVNITDNDSAGVTIAQTDSGTAVAEGAATGDIYTAVLLTQPSANVTITLSANAQLAVNPASITFTPANWSTPQAFTVTAADDAVLERAHSATIAHAAESSDSYYNGLAVASVTVAITDNDKGSLNIQAASSTISVREGGDAEILPIALGAQPTADVGVTIGMHSALTITPATLTFTSTNWSTPQNFSIKAVDDSEKSAVSSVPIALTTASADSVFNSLILPTVIVKITDNDSPGVFIDYTNASTAVVEGGAADTYTVVLISRPANTVTIAVTGSGQAAVSPVSLEFTRTNWNIPQTVTVTAVDDSMVETSHPSATITHKAVSTDSSYNNISIPVVTVMITDNDQPTQTQQTQQTQTQQTQTQQTQQTQTQETQQTQQTQTQQTQTQEPQTQQTQQIQTQETQQTQPQPQQQEQQVAATPLPGIKRECGGNEIPGPNNTCEAPKYRWNISAKKFEKCGAEDSAKAGVKAFVPSATSLSTKSTSASSILRDPSLDKTALPTASKTAVPAAASTVNPSLTQEISTKEFAAAQNNPAEAKFRYTSCQPILNFKLEEKWRTLRYLARPPEKYGEFYTPQWDATTPILRYNPETGRFEKCESELFSKTTVSKGEFDSFTQCRPVPDSDTEWILEQSRAAYAIYKLVIATYYRPEGKTPAVEIPSSKPSEDKSSGKDLSEIALSIENLLEGKESAASQESCSKYLLSFRQNLGSDKFFWKDVRRQLAEAPKEFSHYSTLKKLLAQAGNLFLELDKLTAKGKCSKDILAVADEKLNILHTEIFPEISAYLPDLQNFVDYAQCRNALEGRIERIIKLMGSADDEAERSLNDLSVEAEEKLVDLDKRLSGGDLDASFECTIYADILEERLVPLILAADEKLNKRIEETVRVKFEPVIADFAKQVEAGDLQKKVDEVLVKVAELQIAFEEISKTAEKLSERIATSFTQVAELGDQFKADKTEIQAEKDNLMPIVESAVTVIKNSQCIKGADQQAVLDVLGNVAVVNWLSKTAGTAAKKVDSFMKLCRAKDVAKGESRLFIDDIEELIVQNMEESYKRGLTSFPDVPTHEWYASSMRSAFERGILKQGRPGDSALAQEALKMVLKEFNVSDIEGECDLSHPTVTSVSNYAICAVNRAAEKGLSLPSDMKQPVMRLQIAQWIYVLGNYEARKDVLGLYKDLDNAGNADKEAISSVIARGIMIGDANYWKPAQLLSRASLAKILDLIWKDGLGLLKTQK